MKRESVLDRLAVGAVRALLRLYPRRFRRRYADDMAEAFRDRLQAAPPIRRPAVVVRTLVDLLVSGVREWLRPSPRPDRPGDRADPAAERGTPIVDAARQDLRYALRSLVRRPGFSVVAVVTLALGIGATTAIFSVVNGVLLEPLPYPEADRLVMVWSHGTENPTVRGWMSKPDLEDVAGLAGIERAAGYGSTSVTLAVEGGAEVARAGRVTGGLLATMGVEPVLGRDLRADEVGAGMPRRVVLGHALWLERFGGDRDVVGRTIELSEEPFEVIGVAPPGFDFPRDAELWIGEFNAGSPSCGRGCHTIRVVARLEEGATTAGVSEELDALAGGLQEAYPGSNTDKGFRLEGLSDYVVGDVRTGLWIVLGAVALVLLIACVNVANLLLVRASTRRTEMAVRSALGAGRRRIAMQSLTESAVLAVAGAVLGLALAAGAIDVVVRLAGDTLPRIGSVGLDPAVLAFTTGLTGVVALVVGVTPAIRLAGGSLSEQLGSAGRSGTGRREERSRSLLLAVEVGLSVMLLVGAGLLIRSFQQLSTVDLGYETREVTRFQLVLPESRYGDLASVAAFYRDLERRLAELPEVEAVGSVFGAPLGGNQITGEVTVEGEPVPEPGEEVDVDLMTMTPGFLEVLDIPLLEGRSIEPTDVEGSPFVAVVNETLARAVFGEEDPIGKRVRVAVSFGYATEGGAPHWEIVGVVRDVRGDGPRVEPRAEIYVPHAQYGPGYMRVHLEARPGASGLLASARGVVGEVDPNVPLRSVETLDEAVAGETAETRFYMTLLGAFAGLAAVLAAVGLYGVVAYLVSRRRREIGIRMALGAPRVGIVGLVVTRGVVPAALGALGGLLGVVAGGRVLEGVLFGVQPADPAVLLAVTGSVGLIVAAATLLPALRATRVDPTEALRAE